MSRPWGMEHAVAVARRTAHLGNEWAPYYFGRVGKSENATLIKFGTFRILTRGPNKGEKSFRGCSTREVIVTEGEIAAELTTYEVTTGHCGDCFGKKQLVYCVRANGQHDYRPCDRCSGTGRIQVVAGDPPASVSSIGSTLALALVCALAISRAFGVWGCA